MLTSRRMTANSSFMARDAADPEHARMRF